MIAVVDRVKTQGFLAAMLSDQTNWLDELDRETALSGTSTRSSIRLRSTKANETVPCSGTSVTHLGVKTGEVLFIDDNINHIQRAAGAGLHTIHFTTFDDFEKRLCGFLESPAQSRS